MRGMILIPVLLAIATPAAAGLNAYYEGFERFQGKAVPATAHYAVESGRAVAALKGGSFSFRILYFDQEQLLRMVLDSEKQYVDFPVSEGGITASMEEQMKAQIADLPPEQRKMVEDMMKQQMEAPGKTPTFEYVRTGKTATVLDYECSQVEILANKKKTSEYWGTSSPDFAISETERHTVQSMDRALHGADVGGRDGGASQVLRWDAEKDGHPLIMRCFSDTSITLHLQLARFDHKPIPKDLFKIPAGYRKTEMPTMPSGDQ